jgi:microcin C transport system permease protein
MLAYIVRRILFIIPTLFAIILVNFVIVQAAPGGPVDQLIAQLKGTEGGALGRVTGGGGETTSAAPRAPTGGENQSRGARGLDPEFIKELNKLYGFDKPPAERFWIMVRNYLTFDFGTSFYRDRPVIQLIGDKLPVSISLGLWTTLITYLVSIPLGIRKAVRDGSTFDIWTSGAVIIGYAIPGFLFAVLLIVLFAGGSYLSWFPLRGLVSDDWASLDWPHRILDYAWHVTLPVVSLVIGGFASLTMLTKNSFLEEINKQYVVTARAKGLSEGRVLYGHVFRNAMLLVIAGFPAAFVGILFTGALLVEVIFSLDGLGYLGFQAAIGRDYPIMFGTLYVYTLVGLVLKLVSDITYMLVDPRIDFGTRRT